MKKRKSRYGPILAIGLLFMGALVMVNITLTAPLVNLAKAGFDPLVFATLFGFAMLIAWWQRKRAFDKDMVFCGATDATMALPPPITFGWGGSRISPVRKRALQEASPRPAPLRVVNSSSDEDVEEEAGEQPEWREPYRESYMDGFRAIFAAAADNPALLEHMYQKLKRTNRRDADLVEKAYKETVETTFN